MEKEGNMWSSIFSLVTKVTKHVLTCVAQHHFSVKSGQSVFGIFDIADYTHC